MRTGSIARAEAMANILATIDQACAQRRIKARLALYRDDARRRGGAYNADADTQARALRVATIINRMERSRHCSRFWPNRAAALVETIH